MVQKLVQNHHPFIALRGNTYYFRYAIPTHVRKICPSLPVEVKRSLQTDSYSEAVSLVSQKLSLIKLFRRCTEAESIKCLWSQLLDFKGLIQGRVDRQLKPLLEGVEKPQMLPQNVVQETIKKSPTMTEMWTKFVSWKSWNEKRAKDNQRVFDNLLYFLGDIPVGDISKADLKAALTSVAGLPQRNKKAYKDQPLSKLIAMDIPDNDLVSGKYVKEHLKLSQGLFNSYLVRELDVLSVSPTEGLRWEHDDNRYASLTDAEIRQVIERSESRPEWFQWFLLIAVYSGARRSEIASLRPCDFKLCSDTGRHYFVIHEGKTKAARRMVPVHKSLEALGLLQWIGKGEILSSQ